MKESRSFRPHSFCWKGVLNQRDNFNWGVFYKLGDGSKIDFWLDRWCGDTTLHLSFAEIYGSSTHKSLRIIDCLTCEGWDWTFFPNDSSSSGGHGWVPSMTAFRNRISTFNIEQRLDSVRWRPDGRFTVKSTYGALSDRGTRDARASMLWSQQIPFKVKVF